MRKRIHKLFGTTWTPCDKYYIAGVDVLDPSNRKHVRTVSAAYDIFPFSVVAAIDVYEIRAESVRFKIAVKSAHDGITVIAYYSGSDFNKTYPFNAESRAKNDELLEAFVAAHIASLPKPANTVYSETYKKRAELERRDGEIKVTYQYLKASEPDFLPDERSPFDALYFFDDYRTAFYDCDETARAEIDAELI